IAVIIFSGQIADFLGLENIEKKEFFHQNMLQILKQINTFNIYSILIAIIGVLLIIFIPRWFPRIPVLLIALLIPTLISVEISRAISKTGILGNHLGIKIIRRTPIIAIKILYILNVLICLRICSIF